MRTGRLAAAAALVGLAGVVDCASPTLPLPPPLAPSVGPGADADHVTLTAACNPPEGGALIVIVNQGGGQQLVPPGLAVGGALADPCGSWQTSVYAHQGDALTITYQVEDETSQPTLVGIR